MQDDKTAKTVIWTLGLLFAAALIWTAVVPQSPAKYPDRDGAPSVNDN